MKHFYTSLFVILLTTLSFLPTPALADVDYFTITAEEANVTVILKKSGTPSLTPSFYYSTDNGDNWTELSITTASTTIATLASAGDKVMLKGNNPTGFGNTPGASAAWWYFDIAKKASLSGNIMSLIDENATTTTIPAQRCFFRCFKNCKITDISNLKLPATTLTYGCYNEMFYGCSEMTNVMARIPATTLDEYCCESMFLGCKKITSAPALPATTMANYCYNKMFSGCSALTSAPDLPATTLATNCYSSMFISCTALETAPELPATTLANNCYISMFNGCTNLTKAPSELPAATLTVFCYKNMFYGCTALETAPVIKAITFAPKPSIDENGCMAFMFKGCSSLKKVTVYFTAWPAETVNKKDNTYCWLDGTTANSTYKFLCPCALPDVRNVSRIQTSWDKKCICIYTLNVATNGGTWDGTKNEARTIDRVSDEKLSELPEAQKTNYHFKGWYTTSSGAGSKLEIANQTDFNADYTFYARFDTAFTFNVATNGGTWDGTSSTADVIYSLETLPSNPQKEDCNFTGWFTTANDDSETGVQLTGDNKNSFTTNTTFYARFEAATPPTPSVVELDDTQDNTAQLTGLTGSTVDVLLKGRTLVGGCANTLCLPFDLTEEQLAESPLSGCTIWEFGSSTFDGETLHIDANVATEIEAGKPYLVEPAAAVQNLRFEGVTISASTGTELGNNAVRFVGILSPFTMTAGSEDQLFVGAGNKLLRPSSTSALRGFRAWFRLNDGPAQAAPRAKLTFGEKPQVPTGLDNTEKDNSPRKIFINGQLYITHDGATYTPAGNVMPK